MDLLVKTPLNIDIKGTNQEVVEMYLQVYLAKVRLPEIQLKVASALVIEYAKLLADGVKEPYASILLFSTDSRKDLSKNLGITVPHLNNTFKDLATDKPILAVENDKYVINPELVPASQLVFNFSVNDNKG